MFEFFIALFGGMFFIGKFCKEKSKTSKVQAANKANQERDSIRQKEWLSKVTDEELEMKLEAFIFETSNYDKVWSEVSEAYTEMPWESEKFICVSPKRVEIAYGKGVYNKKQREAIASKNRLKALRIMLALRGKLRVSDATCGVPKSSWGGVPIAVERQWSEEETKFMLWITDKLAHHGVKEDLYIRQVDNKAFLASAHPCYRGYYVWEPIIPYYCNMQ